MNETKKSLVWVIEGALSEQLNQAARLNPASHLSKLGWNVTLITAGVPPKEFNGAVHFVDLPWPRMYMLGPLVYHAAAVYLIVSGKLKPDILMFQTDYAPFLLTIAFWNKVIGRKEMKVVMDTRSMPMDTKKPEGRLRALFFKLGHWMAFHLSVSQTAITEEMVKTVGIPKTRLAGVWPSGVNIEEFSSCNENRAWPGADDAVRLIYIGVLRAERNLIAVMEAVRLARQEGVNVVLELVGEGAFRRELEEYARKYGNGAITVSPRIPRWQVPEVLSRADVGLLPFPDLPKMRVSSFIKLFEYMAAGMPVIATRIVAHTVVLEDSDFVFWADDASPEAMARAMKEAYLRKSDFAKLGSNARTLSRRWTWEASAKKLSDSLLKSISQA